METSEGSAAGRPLVSFLRPLGNLWLAEPVGVVGAPATEGLVRRAVEVRRTGGDESELLAEFQAVPSLICGVGRVEGLDPVEPDFPNEALDQVADLARILHVPV